MEIILILILFFFQIANLMVLIFFWRKNNQLNADMASAMKQMVEYLDKQFDSNYESLKKMQEWNEKAFDINSDSFAKIANGEDQTQRFLSRMAEGLGLSTRSNLQDL
jgi:hypothetical protein